MPDELQEAIERSEMGWNREDARETLAHSMQTITIASRMARNALSDIEKNASDVEPFLETIKTIVEKFQAEGITGSRKGGNMTRQQAASLISGIGALRRAFDMSAIVKLSLDLTNQTKSFVDMMQKIEARYALEDANRAADITEHLTSDQLMQVMEWVKENQEEALSEDSL